MTASIQLILRTRLRHLCSLSSQTKSMLVDRTLFNLARHSSSTSTTSFDSSTASGFKTSSSDEAIKLLQEYGVNSPKLLEKIKNIPATYSNGRDAWKNALEVLGSYGVDPVTVASIYIRKPKLLQFSPQRLERSWVTWLDCCHDHSLVTSLVSQNPEFLGLTNEVVHPIFKQLKAVVGSIKYAVQVVLKCPQVMYQGVSELENVSDYLSEVMIVRNVAEYYKSTALGCTLQEIRTRHVFLERCGKYRTPNIKQNIHVSNKNPSLIEICDTSDKEFATKVAGLTLEEYVVFVCMFEEEMKNEPGSESDSDSDDD